MKRWVIGDHHFGHQNIIKYCKRPFQWIDEMDKYMIKQWNSVVGEKDIVYHVGDVSFYGETVTKRILSQLKGTKFLILGNHDRGKRSKWMLTPGEKTGFEKIYDHPIIIDGFIILSHEPLYLSNIGPFINIHGHIHNKSYDQEDYINVSVEVCNYTPRYLDGIIDRIKEERGLKEVE